MRQKAEYSDKYGCNIQFNCGGEPISKNSHGLNNHDIDGAQPKRFTAERARPSPDLSSEHNNEPKVTTEGRSRFRAPAQPRNPLVPEYNLPPLPPPPEVEAQKFIRDTLDVSDIPGSRVKVPRNIEKPDNALKTSDIEGSQPGGGGVSSHRSNHSAIGSALRPHNDMRMDVSDIVTKTKQYNPKKEQENLVSGVEDGLGKAGSGAQRKKEYFDSLRKHGNDVTRAREQGQSTLLAAVSTNAINPKSSQSSAASTLETHFREIDKHNSGLINPKEFETAIQKSGLDISKAKVQEVSKALGAASSSGMIAYQDVLTHLYDNLEASSPSSVAAAPAADQSNTSTAQPQWYLSRQRRIKTEVAFCMGQQPEATSASAANVQTPQEKASRQTRATGKKIQGLARPGEHEHAFGGSSGNGGDNYWFADYQKATDTPASNTKNYHGDGGGGASELWFSKAGEDEKALIEMGFWRPTKDASIGIDFAKRKTKPDGTVKGGGGGEGPAGGGLPPPKPPIVKAKPAPPTRKDRQMAEKDVERVRQLD